MIIYVFLAPRYLKADIPRALSLTENWHFP